MENHPENSESRRGDSEYEILRQAREEASRLGHGYVGTEHLLLAVLLTRDDEVMGRLAGAGIAPGEVRLALESLTPVDAAAPRPPSEQPISSRAKRVLALAEAEARREESESVTSRHVLEGILLEGENPAAGVLRQLGLPGMRARTKPPLEEMRDDLGNAGIRW
jgi:ATP-dependent Clp protease ATP-binding subunit ClpC